jgi:hypothetical protein
VTAAESPSPCAVEGCTRMRRRRDPLCSRCRAACTLSTPGRARCAAPDCDEPVLYRGLRNRHRQRLVRNGDLSLHILRGPGHPHWSDRPGYFAWHGRLRDQRGSASAHPCEEDCGQPAFEWFYVGGCRKS